MTTSKAWFALLVVACQRPTLSEELEQAKADWHVLEMCPVRLEYRSHPERNCPHHAPRGALGATVEGCANIPSCTIYVHDDLDPEREYQVLLHELGHILRGSHGHLSCSEDDHEDVMCPWGADPGSAPSDRDRRFAFSWAVPEVP